MKSKIYSARRLLGGAINWNNRRIRQVGCILAPLQRLGLAQLIACAQP